MGPSYPTRSGGVPPHSTVVEPAGLEPATPCLQSISGAHRGDRSERRRIPELFNYSKAFRRAPRPPAMWKSRSPVSGFSGPCRTTCRTTLRGDRPSVFALLPSSPVAPDSLPSVPRLADVSGSWNCPTLEKARDNLAGPGGPVRGGGRRVRAVRLGVRWITLRVCSTGPRRWWLARTPMAARAETRRSPR